MADRTTHTFRVSLQGEPSIYREIEVISTTSLYRLAAAIVAAFGFDLDHAFGFYSKLTGRDVLGSEPRYELFHDVGESTDSLSVKRTAVADAFEKPGEKCSSSSTTATIGASSWSFSVSAPRRRGPATHGWSRIEGPHPSSTPIRTVRFTEADMEDPKDKTPGVIAPPPLIYLGFLVVGVVLIFASGSTTLPRRVGDRRLAVP